jgi:hypothetical protein
MRPNFPIIPLRAPTYRDGNNTYLSQHLQVRILFSGDEPTQAVDRVVDIIGR